MAGRVGELSSVDMTALLFGVSPAESLRPTLRIRKTWHLNSNMKRTTPSFHARWSRDREEQIGCY